MIDQVHRSKTALHACLWILFSASSAAVAAEEAQPVSARVAEDKIVVEVAGKEFTSYLFGSEHKYPFFFPVVGPASGETLTAWDQPPYPHHSSLYISLDRVKSKGVAHANYWQPRDELKTGQIFSRKPEIVSQDGKKVVLRDKADWIVPSNETRQLRDVRTVTIHAPSAKVRVMDFQFEIEAMEDLVLRQTGHSFFSARMRPELAVGSEKHAPELVELGTGTMVDAQGNRNEEGIRTKSPAWVAAFGTIDGHAEGLAIIQHSGNPMYPAKWFIRNYGFMSPTPFAFDGDTPFEAGKKWTFRYRVVVFTGDADEADIAGWHADFDPDADDKEAGKS